MIKYIASPAQQYALEAAIEMGQPLLVTGEPGTGKTEMARWALAHLNAQSGGAFWPEVLQFNTKTISKASDLFYAYDALAHFQAANLRGNHSTAAVGAESFISLNAFGKAIAYSDPAAAADWAKTFRLSLPEKPMHSVVLIDEVDKAPRDFTNDLLDEILHYRFSIREMPGFEQQKYPAAKIVVILTSNSEKNLPDAFLRRCAFFHIEFPKGQLLRDIVELHLGKITPNTQKGYDQLLAFFEKTREKAPRKAPATAELIAWLRILGLKGYFGATQAERRRLLEYNLSFLVKTKDDLEVVREMLRAAEV